MEGTQHRGVSQEFYIMGLLPPDSISTAASQAFCMEEVAAIATAASALAALAASATAAEAVMETVAVATAFPV